MSRKTVLAALFVSFLSHHVSAQNPPVDAAAVIAASSKAMGAGDLKTIQFSGSGADFVVGQNANPALPWPRFIDKSFTRTVSFDPPASGLDRVRLQGEIPLRGGGFQPLRGENPTYRGFVVDANTPWDQQLEIWMLPHGFVKAAAAAGNATAKSQTIGGRKVTLVSFMGKNGAAVTATVNEQNLIERVETTIDNPVLGDMPCSWTYLLYKNFGGVSFPTLLRQDMGGSPVFQWSVADVKPNVAADIKAAGPAPTPSPLPAETLGEGVFLLKSSSYATLVVDFKDYIVVIESPLDDARGLAIIAEAKKLIPNKPIRYVVSTHTHFDHIGGLRAFVAEGATVITHEVNKPFLEKVFTLPHTLKPDTLSALKVKKKAKFETMTDKKVLTDGKKVIELHLMKGFEHHDGMIFVWLPKERVLMQGDAYNANVAADAVPPIPVSPYPMSLYDNIKRLKLDVDRIVSIHMPQDDRKITMDELRKFVGRTD